MPRQKLTNTSVEAVQPDTKDVIVWDTEMTGFALKVTPKGRRSFLYYYRTADHTQRKPTIGTYPDIKPEAARKAARRMAAEVLEGGDPSAARQAKRAGRGEGILKDLFDDYKAHKESEGLRSIGEVTRIFERDILPVFGKRKPEEISVQEVSKLLDKIARSSPSMAWAVRRQLSAFYSWALPRLPNGTFNPVTNASRPPKVRARERVLSNDELKLLWTVVETEREPWRTAVKLLILTGQRREEVLSAHWSEFDLKARLWTIPAGRAKNKKPHIVPLSPAAVELLTQLPTRAGRLFPKGTGLVSRAAKRVREAMPDVPEWHWHDIRRTVATGMQRLGVGLQVTEAVLNHVSGSQAGIVAVYQRHDWAKEKQEALNKWAAEVGRIVSSDGSSRRK
jgi:integrase